MKFTAAFLSAAVAAITTSSAALADADLAQKMANPGNWASQAGDDAQYGSQRLASSYSRMRR